MNTDIQRIQSEPAEIKRPRRRGRQAAEGLVLGILIGLLANELGISGLLHFSDLFLLSGLVGLCCGLTRLRPCLWVTTGLLLAVAAVIGYTPIMAHMMPRLVRSDRLQPCPAIVILSSVTYSDGSLSAHANERAMQGYLLLRQGFGRQLVMTDATARFGSQIPGVRRQMRLLGLDYPIESAGPASDTRDEAVGVARLAQKHGWKQVILVTHPWHMRRAAALFEKEGVSVLCSPCLEGEYDIRSLYTPTGRLRAFRDWLHEVIGYQIYRQRGWVA